MVMAVVPIKELMPQYLVLPFRPWSPFANEFEFQDTMFTSVSSPFPQSQSMLLSSSLHKCSQSSSKHSAVPQSSPVCLCLCVIFISDCRSTGLQFHTIPSFPSPRAAQPITLTTQYLSLPDFATFQIPLQLTYPISPLALRSWGCLTRRCLATPLQRS